MTADFHSHLEAARAICCVHPRPAHSRTPTFHARPRESDAVSTQAPSTGASDANRVWFLRGQAYFDPPAHAPGLWCRPRNTIRAASLKSAPHVMGSVRTIRCFEPRVHHLICLCLLAHHSLRERRSHLCIVAFCKVPVDALASSSISAVSQREDCWRCAWARPRSPVPQYADRR